LPACATKIMSAESRWIRRFRHERADGHQPREHESASCDRSRRISLLCRDAGARQS
jgi:transposase